jgi:4-amino-4-deoxy-L-arabinose transferase-like glycosyltransferase
VTRARAWLVVLVAAGIAARVCFGLLYWVGQPLTHDEREYLALARSLARGDGFAYPSDEPEPGTAQRFGRAPGYPAFLATLQVTAPVAEVPARIKVAQAFVGGAAIALIAAIAGRAGGSRAALAAASIAAVYPPLVWFPSYALSETLSSAIALTAAWQLQRGADEARLHRRGLARIGLAGAVTGLAILIRPAFVFYVPLVFAWMAVRRRRLLHASVFALTALLCVLPWTLRNHRVYGRWIAVATEGGVTFWTGNHPAAMGEGDLAANPQLKRAELDFRTAHPGLTPEQLEPLYYQDAVRWIRAHPAAWLALEGRRIFYTVVPAGPSYTLHSAKYLVASTAAYLLLLPIAVIGGGRLVRSGTAPVALWLLAAATVLAGLVFFPQERFRIPAIDPALIVSAAGVAALLTNERTGRRPHL